MRNPKPDSRNSNLTHTRFKFAIGECISVKLLKNLTLSLLSLLLFLSLSIFGLAFMLNNTLLNPDFVTSELDRLDVSSLVKELISEPIPREESSAKMMATLVNATTKLEPLVKRQVNTAIYSTYDYLLGKKQSLELAQTLRKTVLTRDFVVSLVDTIDLSSLVSPIIKENLEKQLPRTSAEIPLDRDKLVKLLEDTIDELEPWLKEQVAIAADPILDYLFGQRESLSVVISLEPVKKSLGDKLWASLHESPPPELANLPQSELKQHFDEFFTEFTEAIPSTFVINESLLGTQIPAQLAEALAEAERQLGQARQYVGYFQLGYNALIGFMVLLILGIILMNRRVKNITRNLGTTFLTYGALEYAGIFVAQYFSGRQLSLSGIPPSLQAWLPRFLDNLLSPLEMFSLGLLIGGVALIIVSFVYKPRQPSL